MTGSNPVLMQPVHKRIRYRVRGTVQGVGFRPFVYVLARQFDLSGWVQNDGDGVLIEAEGQKLDAFEKALINDLPPLACIDDISKQAIDIETVHYPFEIRDSHASAVTTSIPADSAICPDCLAEMRDPSNQRYGYPFLNCTHCGPRYSITHSLPYDRAQTSMAGFKMCAACEAEYLDPTNRRFHAQPTCCPDCGPQLSMSIDEICTRLDKGEILAIKGLGGFHLVCDAENENAISTLRQRKNRKTKPFALMLGSYGQAKSYAHVSPAEKDLLESSERPIVLLRKKNDLLSQQIAPNINRIGVMLPYTPLHYLIMDARKNRPLIMTSANAGGDPLVIDNQEAQDRLGTIADAIISHDRGILIRVDDSVVRHDLNSTIMLRRGRGFTPRAINLKHSTPTVLGLGAYLKNTICLTRDNQAFVSQHIGDLDNAPTISFLHETLDHLQKILQVSPELVVHDLHPDFASSRLAQTLGIETFAAQHHHAHIASVMAEHHLDGPIIGVALDGYGMGTDHQSWGGELFVVDGLTCNRIGHLKTLAQAGGDKAAREPWRMGASALHALGRSDEIASRYPDHDTKTLLMMLNKGLNSPQTSSMGRLFDAACGLLDITDVSDYEGHAPMMLESLITRIESDSAGWQIDENGTLDFLPLLNRLCDLGSTSGANLFHGTLIQGLSDWILQACAKHGLSRVALSGGCFLNEILAQGLIRKLQKAGVTPYLNHQVPLSDAGLSLGQVWLGQLKLQGS